ncbi:MAG: hypothetical protein Q9214_006170, partial [Letrouitia sp. 1 TL-2023]
SSSQVRTIDEQLDRFQSPAEDPSADDGFAIETESQFRVLKLTQAIKSLSMAASPHKLRSTNALWAALQTILSGESSTVPSPTEQELEWLLIGKATIQLYGLVINALLERTLPLGHDIWYWDSVLGSKFNTGLSAIQSSPQYLWQISKDVYHDVRQQSRNSYQSAGNESDVLDTISRRWSKFYQILRKSVRRRSLTIWGSKPIAPLMRFRADARAKQNYIKRAREMSACGIGILMDECLTLDPNKGNESSINDHENEWKVVIIKSIPLIDAVLRNVTAIDQDAGNFEDTVFANLEDDSDIDTSQKGSADIEPMRRPVVLANQLEGILRESLPTYKAVSISQAAQYGRPSMFVRYWLPVSIMILSASTTFRFAVRHKAQIQTWISDLGTTMLDFWTNWVLEPSKKVIATIRHDEDSEIAIMSRKSLEGDRASLERMVIDFAMDNPDPATGQTLNEMELSSIRAKVKEGDLTSVLKAYEKDIRRPLIGTLGGNLIRALLIQVQKTKVDIEVAVGGIDSLLKSQELVFGFVGLTPGILVCVAIGRWLKSAFRAPTDRTDFGAQSRMLRVLRSATPHKIDRLLSASSSSNNRLLTYKEHGLLLCEVYELRQCGQRMIPNELYPDFLEEVNDLVDLRVGVERQLRAANRIRWAYKKWLL